MDSRDMSIPEAAEGGSPTPADTLAALRQENESLRRQVEEAARDRQAVHQRQTREAVCRALVRHGAHPDAARLLAGECGGAELGEAGELLEEEALIEPLRRAWGTMFTTCEPVGTSPVAPPDLRRKLPPEALLGMTTDEINRNWPVIKESLREL